MKFISIIALSIVAAILYGIVHDQITARICIEYFTVGHPRLIASDSPTILGLFWGVVSTWWVGLPLGLALAIAARAGRNPRLGALDLMLPLVRLLAIMFACAFLAGTLGFILARAHIVDLVEPLSSQLPPERHVPFLVCGFAHSGSYLSGIAGGLALSAITWRRRKSKVAPLT